MSDSGDGKRGYADEEAEGEDRAWVVRLVLESELQATGRATPTGIDLALYAPEVSGLGAWELGRLWGWSDAELRGMIERDEHLVAVVAPASPNLGRATAQALAGLIHGLRPDEAIHGSEADFVDATQMSVASAERVGLRETQRALTRVFGVRDGAFGTGVIADARRDEESGPAFVIDEKIVSFGRAFDEELGEMVEVRPNPLSDGSSLAVEDYGDIPVVLRLPWDGEEE